MTVPGPGNGCSRCAKLWNTSSPNAFYDHLWEHVPKNKKTFAFTLTTNGDDVAVEETKLINAVYKLYTQQTVPVSEGEAYLEYTEQGRPHIHGWYMTCDGGRIFSKVFQRCWELWGEKRGQTQFRGGYHEEMKSNRYRGYASAEGRKVISKNINSPVELFEKNIN